MEEKRKITDGVIGVVSVSLFFVSVLIFLSLSLMSHTLVSHDVQRNAAIFVEQPMPVPAPTPLLPEKE